MPETKPSATDQLRMDKEKEQKEQAEKERIAQQEAKKDEEAKKAQMKADGEKALNAPPFLKTPDNQGERQENSRKEYTFGDDPANDFLEDAFTEIMKARNEYYNAVQKVKEMELDRHIEKYREERTNAAIIFRNAVQRFNSLMDEELRK